MSERAAETYRVSGFFMLRAPALPARPMLELLRSLPVADGAAVHGGAAHGDAWQDAYADQLLKLWLTPGVPDAVRAASPHLADAVERFDGLTGRNRRKAVRGLSRYLNRMSFRSTPFGLFAGVTAGVFGEEQSTRLGHSALGTARARADSGWVMHLVKRLAFGAERPRELRVRRNDLLHSARGRVWLSTAEGYGINDRAAAPHAGGHGDEGQTAPKGRRSVSVQLTAPVRSVLDHTRTPTTLGDLADVLTEAYPNAGAERIAALLDGLFDSDILITADRPRLLVPPTRGTDRNDSLLRSMLPPVTDPAVARAIDGVEAAISAFNRGELPIPELLGAASAPMPDTIAGHSGAVLQIDSALNLDAPLVLPRPVADLAEAAARLFLRVGAEDRYPQHLKEYADAFSERYGHRSEVPLLEALTPETGLGPPRRYRSPGQAYPLPGVVQSPADRSERPGEPTREAVLNRMAAGALARRELSVQLDDRLLDELAEVSADEDDHRPPMPVLDLHLALQAPGPDRVHWRAICGTAGVMMGGRTFSRFHDLLDDGTQASLRELAAAEERRQGDAVCAELSSLPQDARSINVTIRPVAHTWELPVNVTPGRDEDHVIRLEDVLVGVADGKLYLRSRTLGRRLHVTDRTMLNWTGAPDPCRFLLEVSQALSGTVSWFSWGGLGWSMPFLPRVERGNLVLRRARWRLRPGELTPAPGSRGNGEGGEGDGPAAFADAVDAWARTWMVPRLVNIIDNDNTLLLDLTSAPSLRELHDSLEQAPADGITLEEVLPAPDEGLLRDAAGEPYASEIVVPLVRTSEDPGRVARHIRPRPVRDTADPAARFKRVGSDWLAVKLYAEPDAHDTLLGVGLAGLTARLSEEYGVAAPFFLRYNDPAPHLRVRFFVPEEAARPDVLREVTAWAYGLAQGGHISDHAFVSYQQEVERYGGPELIAHAEEWFRQDSAAVVQLLRQLRASGTGLPGLGLDASQERAALVALTLDRLCAHLVPEPEACHALARLAAVRNAGGGLYRTAGRSLWTARTEDGPTRELLDRASEVWRPAAEQLARRMAELERRGELRADRGDIVLALLHMHCNRMGLRPTEEADSYGVWRRLLDRAAHASH
ncbi:thiopeptide-type bacteriocin biosynthesis protein [Murinocardiopsis flavida]|uniref:Thiopeptide-type bacteriocin biosynthesis protein n=1 Tax=Murinocardiopsis flavida TaxID=645275 RepID=A0A2P8CDP7_9ACTN|nr:lantibiotic dehydratase [Murinocardiopsis flavida]PSK83066.1 thiopeptide-type bacteriocin biosynthesis protein [Murinocardiopsis flavida]